MHFTRCAKWLLVHLITGVSRRRRRVSTAALYAVEARAAFRGALEAGGGEYVPALRGWAQLESDCGNGRRWKKLKKQLSAALGAQHGEAKSPVIFKKLAARGAP